MSDANPANVRIDYATPPGQRPTHVRWVVMVFLCVLSFLTYFDRVCIVRAQKDIQSELSINDAQMGLIFGAFWLAYGLFEIPIGWWGDRFGARFTLTRIVLAWSLFTALSGSAVGFMSLLTYRFLFGVGEAGAFPNMARIQSRWLPVRSRARAGGLLWLMARWGGAFSPVIFGIMLRAFKEWQLPAKLAHLTGIQRLATMGEWRLGFWAAGLMGVVWVLLFYPWFRDDPSAKSSVNRAEVDLINSGRAAGEDSHRQPPGLWGALFSSPSLWALALLYICGSFGWSFFVSWMPRFLDDVHGVKFEKSEWMSAAPLFFGGVSCLVGGWLSDIVIKRTGRRRLGRAIFPILGCSTAAMAMLGLRFVQTPTQAVILMCVAAAAFDFGQGANWASIVDIGGNYAGTATGFINMLGSLGNFLQPVVGAWIFNRLGWGFLFGVYACTYLMAGSMWLFIDPTRKFYERQEPRGFEPIV